MLCQPDSSHAKCSSAARAGPVPAVTNAVVALQVEKIALLNTTLMKWDGSCVLYPNAKMDTDMVLNINRSENKGEVFSVGLRCTRQKPVWWLFPQ